MHRVCVVGIVPSDFLDRIIELEAKLTIFTDRLREVDPAFVDAHKDKSRSITVAIPGSAAFPKALVSERSQAEFVANLKQAMSEIEREDTQVDPVLTSRHVGPAARKRQAEQKEHPQEEDRRVPPSASTETRRASKRQKGNNAAAGAGNQPPSAAAKNGNGNAPGK